MKKLAWLVFMIGSFAAGQTVTVTASHLQNASGQLISGYIYLQPTLTSGQPTWYRAPGGGTVSSAAVPVPVANGVLSVTLPDTTQTYPANLCFTMTYPQGSLATGYNCLQPHTTAYNASDWCQAGVCNLDNYLPGNQPLPTINAVSSINYTAGNLTFSGNGVSQSGNTFTFNSTPQTYPAAGVMTSTGTGFGTSLQTGTAANDLLQLNASAQIPAVSGALLTNLPTETAVQIATTIQTQSGCTTAGYAWVPASNTCVASGGGTSSTSPVYGSLVNQTTWTNLTNYSAFGSTPTVSSGTVVFGTGSTTLTQALDWVSTNNYTTTLPVWQIAMTETVQTITSTSYGLGIGIRSTEYGNILQGLDVYLDTSSDSTAGKLIIQSYYDTTITTVATSSTALSLTAGDSVQTSCNMSYGVLTCYANDSTNSTAVSATYDYDYDGNTAGSLLTPNAGHFTIWNIGGGTLTAFSIYSSAPKQAQFAVVGDSKSSGLWAGTIGNGWAQRLSQLTPTVVEAGPGDYTNDVINAMPEILALAPKNVILNIGRNDICQGAVPVATVEANYSTIVSDLTTAGITVYHLLPLWEPSCDQSAFSSWIASTYPSANIINVNLQQYGAAFALYGNVHPSPAGSDIIFQDVLQALSVNNDFLAQDAIRLGALRGLSAQSLFVDKSATVNQNMQIGIPASLGNAAAGTGFVGIGQTTPAEGAAKVAISNDPTQINTYVQINSNNNGATTNGEAGFVLNGPTITSVGAHITQTGSTNSCVECLIEENWDGDAYLESAPGATTKGVHLEAGGSERVTAMGNGYIGINNSSPQQALDVSGTIGEVLPMATSVNLSGFPVKADTANSGDVAETTTTDTGAGVAIGVCFDNPAFHSNKCSMTISGIVPMTMGTGTCAIGQFVIVDTTTNGDIKCTGTYSAGTVIGVAMSAQSTVGSAVNVQVGLR